MLINLWYKVRKSIATYLCKGLLWDDFSNGYMHCLGLCTLDNLHDVLSDATICQFILLTSH